MTLDNLKNRIVSTPEICGGQPRIAGHRITVKDIVKWFEVLQMSADAIADEYDLNLYDIYLALAYYHANQEELQKEWEQQELVIETLQKQFPSRLKPHLKGGQA